MLVKGAPGAHINLHVNELVIVDPGNGFGGKPLSTPSWLIFYWVHMNNHLWTIRWCIVSCIAVESRMFPTRCRYFIKILLHWLYWPIDVWPYYIWLHLHDHIGFWCFQIKHPFVFYKIHIYIFINEDIQIHQCMVSMINHKICNRIQGRGYDNASEAIQIELHRFTLDGKSIWH